MIKHSATNPHPLPSLLLICIHADTDNTPNARHDSITDPITFISSTPMFISQRVNRNYSFISRSRTVISYLGLPLTVTITEPLLAKTCSATAPHAAPVTSLLLAPQVLPSFNTVPAKIRGEVPTCKFFTSISSTISCFWRN